MKKSAISNQALNVLDATVIEQIVDEWFLYLPKDRQLERNLYLEVNKVLETFGGKWNKKLKAHVFSENPEDLINDALLTGDYTRLDKNGFFPTPIPLAHEIVQMFSSLPYESFDVLEPSCGDGNLSFAIHDYSHPRRIVLVEPNSDLLAKAMERHAKVNRKAAINTNIVAVHSTFEDYFADYINSERTRLFERVIMNPPFERGQDASHITMAIDLLAPNGELVAICSAGLLFRQDKKYSALRDFLAENGGIITQLPEGTFKESGTNVNTVLIYYKNTKENTEMKNEESTETIVETPTTTTKTKTTANSKTTSTVAKTPKADAPPMAESESAPIADAEHADNLGALDTERVADSIPESDLPNNGVYTVNKTDGAITTVDRMAVEAVFDGKYSKEAVAKMLDGKKVLSSGENYYSTERAKLAKFEKKAESAPSDAAENEKQPVTPKTEETPSNAPESAGNDDSAGKSDTPNPPSTKTDGDTAQTLGNNKPEPHYELDAETHGFEIGDKVINVNNGHQGIVINRNNALVVSFEVDNKPKSASVSDKWRKMTPDEIQAEKDKLALAKPEPAKVEVLAPLTEAEKAELAERENTIKTAKTQFEQAENIIAENASIIRSKELWRESLNKEGKPCKSFAEYVTDVLGFVRAYGQNLAQIGDFRQTAKELTGDNLNISINANNAMLRAQNRIAEAMGLGELTFNEMKPIINASMTVLGELVKDQKTGDIDYSLITPRVITAAAEKIVDFVKTDTVEINGEQMTIEDAKKKGLLDTAFHTSVMQQASESILVHKQIIKDNIQKANEERNKPVVKDTNPSLSVDEYKGKLPNLQIKCAKHGDTTIISIGNGVLQTKCGDRWRISADTGKLVPYEVDGKKVKGK